LAEILAILASWAITIPAIALILWRDERRMTPEQREHAWPPASRLSAIGYSLLMGPLPGVLVLPIHFTRTRRTAFGFFLGVLFAVAVFALDIGAAVLISLAFGEDP
jgi:hypothetical protein